MASILSNVLFLLQLTLVLLSTITVLSAETPVPVQGYVYCKSCQYKGNDTLSEATPLAGAVVRLQCNRTQNPLVQEEATTNKNGYFAIKTQTSLTTAEFEHCKVLLTSSSKETCSIPTDLNFGLNGAILKDSHKVTNKETLSIEAFTVGPFAFEPSTGETCIAELRVDDLCDPECLLICSDGCCNCDHI